MKVAKFGGTSVGSAEAIRRLVGIIRDRGFRLVVVSALSGVTDSLIALGRQAAEGGAGWNLSFDALKERHRGLVAELFSQEGAAAVLASLAAEMQELGELLGGLALVRELSPRSLDLVMSFGERLSSKIVAAALVDAGIPAEAFDARELIVAEGEFGAGRPRMAATEAACARRLGPYLDGKAAPRTVPVITGFIAANQEGNTLTLGRGGSDFTASILGAAIGADEVEIWTDVDGIMTSDPRKVGDAFSMECLSYHEAMELSHFGAKVIYPPTIRPAFDRGIPIRILNSFRPEFSGTLISATATPSRYPVRGISSIASTTLIRLQGPGMVGVTGIAGRFFGCLARRKINIILISQASSEQSICVAVSGRDRDEALAAVAEEFALEIADGSVEPPIAENDKAILAIVGERMRHSPGISGRVFHALGRNGVNVTAIAQGSSELNISAVVDEADESKALNAVHDAFFLSGTRSVNVFVVGTGRVGGMLLDQIARHRTLLLEDYSIRLGVAGVTNRRSMLLRPSGIDLESWRGLLEAEGRGADLDTFISEMRSMRLPNTVFVDCSAWAGAGERYLGLLSSSIAVVTPNKEAGAGPLDRYRALAAVSRSTGTPYLYGSTVCAGLPVLSTLHDLRVSGDRVHRVDAALSGTMTHLFAGGAGGGAGRRLGDLLREAKSLGYTEPDPRDDLFGTDSARKALILARELGYPAEFRDIEIMPFLPPRCLKAESFDELLRALGDDDATILDGRGHGLQRDGGFVFSASIEEGQIGVELRGTRPGDPLHGLRGGENAVAFYTDRYQALPLVVRGPGAGAGFTAGGLLADIVRVAQSLA